MLDCGAEVVLCSYATGHVLPCWLLVQLSDLQGQPEIRRMDLLIHDYFISGLDSTRVFRQTARSLCSGWLDALEQFVMGKYVLNKRINLKDRNKCDSVFLVCYLFLPTVVNQNEFLAAIDH